MESYEVSLIAMNVNPSFYADILNLNSINNKTR